MITTRKTALQKKSTSQQGFTIVELLIATTVFSLVLLVILYGVLSFTHAYYGGVNRSSTQNSARSIINAVAEGIEFSGSTIVVSHQVSGNGYAFCAGGSTYYYTVGVMYTGTPSAGNAGLYYVPGTCLSSTAPNFTNPVTGSRELLNNNMRVTYFSVAQSPSAARVYTVSLGIAYGYSDLLCSVSGNGSTGGCLGGDGLNSTTASVVGTSATDVQCKQVTGSEFCAHAGLSTTVSLRVSNGALAP